MGRRKKTDTPPQNQPPCSYAGCEQPGSHKAPKSRDSLHEYRWLCLDHVREYNKAWDFFSGFSREQIESFMKDAMTGHRPTWKISQKTAELLTPESLEEALAKMLNGSAVRGKTRGPRLNDKQRKAYAVLEIEPPASPKELKAQYKLLVKKYHPDLNQGNKKAEERFKMITQSYKFLVESEKAKHSGA